MILNAQVANSQLVNFDLEGSYSIYEGPYYIRFNLIYYYEETNDWTLNYTSQELEAFAVEALANLNNAYNPHQIFFYFDEPTCGVIYKKEPQSLPEQAVLNPDALNIFVDDDAGIPLGEVQGIPDNFANVRGMDGANLVTATPILVHEVGHCLGLFHLNGLNPGTCTENDPNNPNPAECSGGPSSCNCCGDSVCDTDILSDNIINATSGCATAINHPDNPSQATIRNYMTNTTPVTCNDRFTDEQVARMWEMLAVAPGLQAMQIQNAATAYTGVLPGGTYGNIVVENGTTLEINAPIAMEPTTYIRVEKNATLRVRSTITGACDEMWRGIIVEGRPRLSQTTTNQGRVVVHSTGKIEHAWIGVDLGGTGTGGGGGILTAALGSTFENNSISVYFGEYHREANKSRFWASEFYITDDYRANAVQPVMIRGEVVEQLVLLSPTFKDLRTQCIDAGNQAIGVELFDASARFLSGTFENLSTGIYVDQIDEQSGSFAIGTATFTNCLQSIHTNVTSSFAINNNTFEMATPSDCPSSANNDLIGVAMHGETTGFTFKGNDFEFIPGSSLSNERIIGTLVEDTGEGMGNTLLENSYTELFEGILANLSNDGADDGMLFLCNTFTDMSPNGSLATPFSIHVEEGASVRMDQGRYDMENQVFLPAGNIFSIEAFTFYNNPLNPTINYYFNENVAAEDPNFTTEGDAGLELFPLNAAGCSTIQPPCDYPPCSETLVGDWTSGFHIAKDDWQTRIANLPNIIDTTDLAAERDTIRFLRQEMNVLTNKLIQQYSLDTNGVATDSIIAWLQRSETYSTDMRLARHYFFTRDSAAFDALWPQIPLTYSLINDQQDDYDELTQIYGLLRPHLLSGGSVFEIGQTELDSLSFWSEWCSEPGYLVRSLLRYNGSIVKADCLNGGIEGRSNKSSKEIQSYQEFPLGIYPNPADGILTISLKEESLVSGTIEFYTLQGHLIARTDFETATKEITVGVSGIPTGLYLVRAVTSGRTLQVGKVTIIH